MPARIEELDRALFETIRNGLQRRLDRLRARKLEHSDATVPKSAAGRPVSVRASDASAATVPQIGIPRKRATE